MNTQNTRGNDPKHECEFSECFLIICAITWHGGGNHTHCKECGVVGEIGPRRFNRVGRLMKRV